VEKEDGDCIVQMKKNKAGRKIYRCRAGVAMPPSLLVEALKDTDNVTSWNATLTESRVLRRISPEVAISYQVTTSAAGGMVSARDFIYISRAITRQDGVFIIAGRSVEFQGGPSSRKLVRAVNGPGCQMVEPGTSPDTCRLVWLMDCEYRGLMPQSVLDIALPIAQTSFVECVRKLASKLKAEGRF